MARIPSPEPVDPATLEYLATLPPAVIDTTMSLVRTLAGFSHDEKLAVGVKLVEAAGDLGARPESVEDYANQVMTRIVDLLRHLDREAMG